MTPRNLSRPALRDITEAITDMVANGARTAYDERFAVAVAEIAGKIRRPPLFGHRRLVPLGRLRAVRGFNDLLVYDLEHPARQLTPPPTR